MNDTQPGVDNKDRGISDESNQAITNPILSPEDLPNSPINRQTLEVLESTDVRITTFEEWLPPHRVGPFGTEFAQLSDEVVAFSVRDDEQDWHCYIYTHEAHVGYQWVWLAFPTRDEAIEGIRQWWELRDKDVGKLTAPVLDRE